MSQRAMQMRERQSLNQILRKYVQDYKHELKLMDEDEDEDDDNAEVEEMAKSIHANLDEELLGQTPLNNSSAGPADDSTSQAHHEKNTSILSFVNDLIRENSPDLVTSPPGGKISNNMTRSALGGSRQH